MDKTPAKSAATATKSPEAAFAEAKANFEGALAKTKAEAGEAGPEAQQAEQKPEPKPKRESAEDLKALKAEMAEMKRQLAEKAKQEPKRKEPEPEVDEDFESVRAELIDQFGEDEGNALGRALKAIVEPKERRLAQIEKLLEDGMRRGRKQIAQSNRSRLAAAYPNLQGEEGDEAWEIVKKAVESVLHGEPDKYDSPEAAYDATARALYGHAKKPSERPSDEDVEEASRIAASQPTQPERSRAERRPTHMQASRQIFDHLRKNPDDVTGARAIANKAKLKD